MDDHIRKLNTRTRNKEAEFNALYSKIQKLEKRLPHYTTKKFISKELETVEMSLTGVLEVIFEEEEEE